MVCWQWENKVHKKGETSRRFYTNQHQFDCGIDLHARSMDVCVVRHEGAIVLHRHMKAAPDPFLKAVAPLVRGWSWRADLGTNEGMPFV